VVASYYIWKLKVTPNVHTILSNIARNTLSRSSLRLFDVRKSQKRQQVYAAQGNLHRTIPIRSPAHGILDTLSFPS